MAILTNGVQSIATFFDGKWQNFNAPIINAADHVAWLGSQVFDGARYFNGVIPDLDLHCARLITSARILNMEPCVEAADLEGIVRDGVKLFPPEMPLYIRPMMWTTESGPGVIDVEPSSTRFAVCIEALPMPEIGNYSLTVSPFRRPQEDVALTGAKTGSLYPNNSRIMAYARSNGFSNALSLDMDGFVAETASTNVFAVKDGVVETPVPNGCFLNGLTRQRVIQLLRDDGLKVREVTMTTDDFTVADEIFITGNIPKVLPVTRFQKRDLQVGRIALRARELYMDFAHSHK